MPKKKRPAGRLPANPEARNITLCGRFSAKEARFVKQAADKYGETVSDLIRKAALSIAETS